MNILVFWLLWVALSFFQAVTGIPGPCSYYTAADMSIKAGIVLLSYGLSRKTLAELFDERVP